MWKANCENSQVINHLRRSSDQALKDGTSLVSYMPFQGDTSFRNNVEVNIMIMCSLQVRIEQVLLGSPPLLLCFSLSQLLGFYTNLVDKLLGNDANLTQTLASCRQLASRRFQEQLKQMGEKLLRYVPPPPKDLSVPNQVH